jgi:hypothetical protein
MWKRESRDIVCVRVVTTPGMIGLTREHTAISSAVLRFTSSRLYYLLSHFVSGLAVARAFNLGKRVFYLEVFLRRKRGFVFVSSG